MADTPVPSDIDRQAAAVERIIARRFEPDQIDAPTITPSEAAS